MAVVMACINTCMVLSIRQTQSSPLSNSDSTTNFGRDVFVVVWVVVVVLVEVGVVDVFSWNHRCCISAPLGSTPIQTCRYDTNLFVRSVGVTEATIGATSTSCESLVGE
jgi:hypothetical protein